MKRVALLCVGLAVGAASAAEAQLTMQMSNGWSFTFSGNVNAFAIYESTSDEGGTLTAPGGLIGIGYPIGQFDPNPAWIWSLSWSRASVAMPLQPKRAHRHPLNPPPQTSTWPLT